MDCQRRRADQLVAGGSSEVHADDRQRRRGRIATEAWEGRQIRMDVVLAILPPKLREAINIFSELVMIAAAAAVTIFAWPVISQLAAFDQRSQAANFPLFIPQMMVPLGYSLMGFLV